MAEEPVHYQPPAEHEQHVRKLGKFLIIFFVALFILGGLVVLNAQKLASALPFSAEQRFANGIARTIDPWLDSTRDAEYDVIEGYLQTMANELASDMTLPSDHELKVHFLDWDELNAFATIGGHIFVMQGLVESLPDENSLAMVLAHEIAHVKHRDPLAGVGRGIAIQIIYSFLTGNSQVSADYAAMTSQAGMLFFSREQETAADIVAMEGLHTRYGHVAGSDALFRIVADAMGEKGQAVPDWLLSHPEPASRIEELAAHALSQGWRYDVPRPYPQHITEALESVSAR